MVALLLINVFSLIGKGLKESDQSVNYLVPEYTRILVDNLEPNAIIISAQWDYWVSAFWYKQKIEGYRPDITLIEKELLRRTWYLNQLKRWYPKEVYACSGTLGSYLDQLELFESGQPYDPLLDEPLGLFRQPFQVMLFAQRQLMLAHVDHRFLTALPAFHTDLLCGLSS
jgi:hypothetical protein